MNTLLLASALLFAPMVAEETPKEEEITQVEKTPTTEEKTETEQNNEEKEKIDVEGLKTKLNELLANNEWLQQVVKTLGIVYGALGGSSFFALIVVCIRAINNSLKNKRITKETLTSVKEAVLKEVESSVGKEVKDQIEKPIEQLTSALVSTEQLQIVLSKIVALSQENSYQSRLAILELISTLPFIDKKDIEEAKEEVIKEEKEEKETLDNAHSELDKVIEETQEQEETNIVL